MKKYSHSASMKLVADRRIFEKERWDAKIISVHKNAANFVSDGQDFLSFTDSAVMPGPGRIMMPFGDFDKHFACGDSVFFSDGILKCPCADFEIDASCFTLWEQDDFVDLCIPNVSNIEESVLDFVENFMPYCRVVEQDFGRELLRNFYISTERDLPPFLSAYSSCYISDPVYARLVNLWNLDFIRANRNDLNDFFKGSVGFGYGLTPSGDDLILGFLTGMSVMKAVLNFDFPNKAFPGFLNLLSKVLENTPYISACFLRFAIAGRYPDELAVLFRSMLSADKENILRITEYFLRHGHSSGREIVIGYALGLLFCCISYVKPSFGFEGGQ